MNKKMLNKKIFIVCMFPIKKYRDEFITHIPIRLKKILGEKRNIYLLYAGNINENLLISNGLIPVKLFSIKSYNSSNLLIEFIYKHIFLIRLFFTLNSEIKKKKPYSIINMNLHVYNFIFGFLGKLFGVKTIARVTGNIYYNRPKTLKGFFNYKYTKLIEIISLYTMDKIICISNYLTKQIPKIQNIQNKTKVLSPGIDTKQFLTNNHFNKDIDLIFVGRIEPIKNINYAFEIFSEIEGKGLSVNFHLFGNGSELSKLKNKQKGNQNIFFHGEVSHKEIIDFLRKSKVLILTSLCEGFGNVVLEAMLCKVLVVVTPVSDMKNLIGNNKRGLIINYHEPKSSANKIALLINNEKERRDITENALKYVIKNHSVETLRESYQKILLE